MFKWIAVMLFASLFIPAAMPQAHAQAMTKECKAKMKRCFERNGALGSTQEGLRRYCNRHFVCGY